MTVFSWNPACEATQERLGIGIICSLLVRKNPSSEVLTVIEKFALFGHFKSPPVPFYMLLLLSQSVPFDSEVKVMGSFKCRG